MFCTFEGYSLKHGCSEVTEVLKSSDCVSLIHHLQKLVQVDKRIKLFFFKIINWLLSWCPIGSNRFWWNLMWFTTLSLTTKQPCLMNTGMEHARRAGLNGSLSGRTQALLIAPPSWLITWRRITNLTVVDQSVLKSGLELVSSRPGFSFLCGEKSGWAGGVMVSEGIHLSTGSALLLNLLNHPRWEKQEGARLQDFLFHF